MSQPADEELRKLVVESVRERQADDIEEGEIVEDDKTLLASEFLASLSTLRVLEETVKLKHPSSPPFQIIIPVDETTEDDSEDEIDAAQQQRKKLVVTRRSLNSKILGLKEQLRKAEVLLDNIVREDDALVKRICALKRRTSAPTKQPVPFTIATWASDLQLQEMSTNEPHLQTTLPPTGPYMSSLKCVRSYRFSPHFDKEKKLLSLTYTHKLSPGQPICRFELHGSCRDFGCPYQHQRQYVPNIPDIINELKQYKYKHGDDDVMVSDEGHDAIFSVVRETHLLHEQGTSHVLFSAYPQRIHARADVKLNKPEQPIYSKRQKKEESTTDADMWSSDFVPTYDVVERSEAVETGDRYWSLCHDVMAYDTLLEAVARLLPDNKDKAIEMMRGRCSSAAEWHVFCTIGGKVDWREAIRSCPNDASLVSRALDHESADIVDYAIDRCTDPYSLATLYAIKCGTCSDAIRLLDRLIAGGDERIEDVLPCIWLIKAHVVAHGIVPPHILSPHPIMPVDWLVKETWFIAPIAPDAGTLADACTALPLTTTSPLLLLLHLASPALHTVDGAMHALKQHPDCPVLWHRLAALMPSIDARISVLQHAPVRDASIARLMVESDGDWQVDCSEGTADGWMCRVFREGVGVFREGLAALSHDPVEWRRLAIEYVSRVESSDMYDVLEWMGVGQTAINPQSKLMISKGMRGVSTILTHLHPDEHPYFDPILNTAAAVIGKQRARSLHLLYPGHPDLAILEASHRGAVSGWGDWAKEPINGCRKRRRYISRFLSVQ